MWTASLAHLAAPTLASLALAACTGGGAGAPSTGTQGPDGVLAHLSGAETGAVFALHPYPHEVEGAGFELFHGFPVLESARLDARTLGRLLALVEEGIEAAPGRVAACFNPRHGIRVEAGGGTTDLVICYECLAMHAYVDGEQREGYPTAETPEAAVTALFVELGLSIHAD